jgi:hypothetical protein
LTDAECKAALEHGREEAKRAARSVKFIAASRMIELVMASGAKVVIPCALFPYLEDVPVSALRNVELSPLGSAIGFSDVDLDYSVAGLIRDALGRELQQTSCRCREDESQECRCARERCFGWLPQKVRAAAKVIATTKFS